MTVSNEDRDAAVRHLQQTECVHYEHQDELATLGRDEARMIVDALIAHGWGPRPTVRQADIAAYATKVRPTRGASAPDIAAMHITAFLLQQGIEVTSD